MSIATLIKWTKSEGNEAAIANSQDVEEGKFFKLVANVPNDFETYTFDKMIRKIRFSSEEDNAGVVLKVKGVGAPFDVDTGNPVNTIRAIEEEISFGDESVNLWKKIVSVQVLNEDASDISIGFGDSGITDYVFMDSDREQYTASVQIEFFDRDAITATVYQSSTKTYFINDQSVVEEVESIPAFPIVDLVDVEENKLVQIDIPVSIVWASISGTASDSLNFTVIQQGI